VVLAQFFLVFLVVRLFVVRLLVVLLRLVVLFLLLFCAGWTFCNMPMTKSPVERPKARAIAGRPARAVTTLPRAWDTAGSLELTVCRWEVRLHHDGRIR
jgi:hypothetical protein